MGGYDNIYKQVCFAENHNQRVSPLVLKNLPRELKEPAQAAYYIIENPTFSLQSVEEIMKIVEPAKTTPPVSCLVSGFVWGGEKEEEVEKKGDLEEEVEEEEEE